MQAHFKFTSFLRTLEDKLIYAGSPEHQLEGQMLFNGINTSAVHTLSLAWSASRLEFYSLYVFEINTFCYKLINAQGARERREIAYAVYASRFCMTSGR